jgi:pimeloyl-ACP methyl ester carboxylesterase
MPDVPQRHLIPALTHGVVLVREARAAASRGLLVGFHGYMETAAIQMDRLQAIPGSTMWTLVSIEALHRFYRGRTQDVVASWMTRADRDVAIADNLAYVGAALDEVPHDSSTRIVCAGFSQGVAMAFRAGLLGRDRAHGIIAVGGDVPPELLADPLLRHPSVFLARGARDECVCRWSGSQ